MNEPSEPELSVTDPSETEGRRRNLLIPDRLWYAAQKAAADESRRTGEPVSVSEYFRRAVAERLAREPEESEG